MKSTNKSKIPLNIREGKETFKIPSYSGILTTCSFSVVTLNEPENEQVVSIPEYEGILKVSLPVRPNKRLMNHYVSVFQKVCNK